MRLKINTSKLYLNTTPIDKDKASKAIRELYQFCNKKSYATHHWKADSIIPNKDPHIVFVNGPTGLGRMAYRQPNCINLNSYNDIAHFGGKRYWDSESRISSVISKIFHEVFTSQADNPVFKSNYQVYNDYSDRRRLDPWEKLASKVWEESYICFTYQDVCYVVERPLLVKTNNRGFHCKDGPAIVFHDGSEIYCWEGIKVEKDNILYPERMTLKDIHQYNNCKYLLIDLCGVDRYLELCKAWNPNVKGKFAKFFSFSEMILPEKPDARELKSKGRMYKDNPYTLTFSSGLVNGKHATQLKDNYGLYVFWDNIFDSKPSSDIFNPEDRELWDSLNIEEMRSRGPMEFSIIFQNGLFSLKTKQNYLGHCACSHDIAPAWFKAKMFRKQNAIYETDRYVVKYEDGKLLYDGELEERGNLIPANEGQNTIKCRQPLFSGCENLPYYKFDVDISSDSWERLLEKWERLAFDWLAMHEDSTCM